MTAKKDRETSPVASTAVEREHRPDATGALLEKQKSVAQEYRAGQAGKTETPDVAVAEPKPPKRKYVSVQAAVRNHSEIKAWFVRDLLHREGTGAATYSVDGYRGTVEALPGIVERHVLLRVDLSRSEQRFKELLAVHKQQPIPAETEITQQPSKSGRVTIAPRIKRPIGPSDFQSVIATGILLRALAVVAGKDSMLSVKAEVVRREITLQQTLETWDPEKKTQRPGATAGDNPSSVIVTDTEGRQIFAARMALAEALEIARGRELLKVYHKKLKAESRWLYNILGEVDQAAEIALATQLKKDCVSQIQFCRAMLKAGYTDDFWGASYQQQLDKLENEQ